MNFLHLSFEDFFAYKLKFLSDIASPFNERLLASASFETFVDLDDQRPARRPLIFCR